jgi:non-ribosomal peptide synthetase component F
VYRRELFEADAIARMARHYTTLLESIVAQPDARISALEMLDEAEREQRDQEKQDSVESRSSRYKTVRRRTVDASRLG